MYDSPVRMLCILRSSPAHRPPHRGGQGLRLFESGRDSVTFRDPRKTSLQTSLQEFIRFQTATGSLHPVGFEFSTSLPNK